MSRLALSRAKLVVAVRAPAAVGTILFILAPGGLWRLDAFWPGCTAVHKLVQGRRACQRVGLEREVLVGAQVVDPQLLGPRGFAGAFLLKEQHVGLHALRVEQARGQAQQGVHVALVQQLFADGFARAAFEEHVVGQHHRGAAVIFSSVLMCCTKLSCLLLVVAQKSSRSMVSFSVLTPCRLHPRWWCCSSCRRAGWPAPRRSARRGRPPAHRPPRRAPTFPEPMPCSIRFIAHSRAVACTSSQPREGARPSGAFLLAGQVGVVLPSGSRGRQQKPPVPQAGSQMVSPGWGACSPPWPGSGARREVLARAALGVLRVLLQQALVGVALHVGAQNRPVFASIRSTISAAAWPGPELVLRLAEDQAQRAFSWPSASSVWR
jgi:hypothetical protein